MSDQFTPQNRPPYASTAEPDPYRGGLRSDVPPTTVVPLASSGVGGGTLAVVAFVVVAIIAVVALSYDSDPAPVGPDVTIENNSAPVADSAPLVVVPEAAAPAPAQTAPEAAPAPDAGAAEPVAPVNPAPPVNP